MTVDGQPHLIMVYCGGHGASKEEKQVFLFNSDDPREATYNIEFKLRWLINDAESTARLFAIYDCCRVEIANLTGLAEVSRGG